MEEINKDSGATEEVVKVEGGVTSASDEQLNTEAGMPVEEKIDWKKQAEDLEKELNQAKFTLKEKNMAEKKAKKSEEFSDEYLSDDEEEVSKETVAQLVEKEVEKAQLSMRVDVINEELDKLASDPDERRVIQLFYENKIVKSGFDRGSIKKDLEFAHVLANRPRLEKVASEIQKKKESESAMSSNGGSGGHKIASDSSTGAELSDADKRLMAKYGIKPQDINRN
jgi:hypothetical protein